MRYESGTFITVPNKNKLSELDAISQCVFMWLCSHANAEGNCYPSIRRLQSLCKVSRNTVKNRIMRLIEAGLLSKTIRKDYKTNTNHSNFYQIIIVGNNDVSNVDYSESDTDYPGSSDDPGVDHQMASNSIQYEQNSLTKNMYEEKNFPRSYLDNIPDIDIIKLSNKYNVDEEFILRKAEDVINYCESNGKNYVNYKSALQTFIKKELRDDIVSIQGNPSIQTKTTNDKYAAFSRAVESYENNFD